MTLQEYIDKYEALFQQAANRMLNDTFPEYDGNLVFEVKPGHSILEGWPTHEDNEEDEE